MSLAPLQIKLPPEGTRCTDIFAETLQAYQGIEKVEYNYEDGSLKAIVDQRIISNERAMQIIRQAGEAASLRVAQCAAKRDNGNPACANCAEAMGLKLQAQYQAAAALPTVTFQDGVISATLTSRA
jgi:hypothetical protein